MMKDREKASTPADKQAKANRKAAVSGSARIAGRLWPLHGHQPARLRDAAVPARRS